MNIKGNTKEFKNVGIELDGIRNFIVVYNHNGDITYPLKYKKDSTDPIKFVNMDLAVASANAVFNSKDNKVSYKLIITTKNGRKEYDMKDAMEVDGYFQLYDLKKNIKYYIKEKKEPKVRWIGYISLDNGYNERKDKAYGIQRSKQLFEALENSMQKFILFNDDNGIGRIEKRSSRDFVLHIKNSTAKIHIMGNSNIMDLNQRRKERGERVIPFEKNVDKFLTIYVYITAENSEMKFFNSADKALDVLYKLIDDVYNNSEDLDSIELINIEFSGFLKDDVR
ncbi:MAG: hypothetical protein IKR19_08075 [Acholeplasmatales bacterium]|nr:hypothetical protein [Acholeplasmatales bacterium]